MSTHALDDFRWNLPNALSALRLALVPSLLWVAWLGEAQVFLALITVALASDVLDGWIARATGEASEAGCVLDSRADLALWLAMPLCTWWLRPDFVAGELGWVVLLGVAFVLPMVAGWLKFRALTSYHTWGAKLSSVAVGGALLLIWAGGPGWPFRIAAAIAVLALLEEIAITSVLAAPAANVRTFWHVRREHLR
ncbi:MAG: CDP-alcohol phosphatidyltransferase family protein [bacterium]|nr:CDP-alcohol phosphatidyltransferase family protein [bacterium]MCP5071538.1 CDP-alcohol phosphatidyltransferase family protein [bacterium]